MEPLVYLKRVETSVEDGTIGVLFVNGVMVCLTLEPPMNGNKNGNSCILAATYRCVKDDTGRHKHFKILDVVGRSDVEWHTGNIWSGDPEVTDTEACILTGTSVGQVLGKRGVRGSRAAMKSFKEYLNGAESFNLIIENCF